MSPEPGRAATDAPPPPGGLAARAPKIAPVTALEGRRVLVVDDSVPVARSTARLLELFGARPQAVFSGAEALRRLEAAAFDLVLLDLNLPDLDGREVLRRARALRPGLPAIFVSGLLPTGALREDGVELLAKPFALSALLAAIEAALAAR